MAPSPERRRQWIRTLYCPHCRLTPHLPVTALCGHTSCLECVGLEPRCPCGEQYHDFMNVDILVQKLILLVQTSKNIGGSPQDIGRVSKRGRANAQVYARLRPRDSNGSNNGRRSAYGSSRRKMINFASLTLTSNVAYTRQLKSELECPVCCLSLRRPVCTPCGHTFCRPCIERVLDFGNDCPMCKAHLADFNIDATADTVGVCLALRSLRLPVELPPEPNRGVPLFVCTVAYPNISCPLLVFEPRYRLMLRRVMRSQTRTFGMVPVGSQPEYGTLLELRDIVRLSDGRSIVTSVGVARFQVLERRTLDGYNVASVSLLSDVTTHAHVGLTEIMTRMSSKMEHWLHSKLSSQTRADILESYGPMPSASATSTDDGPALCWWLLAIMPLPPSVKETMLRTVCPMRRMWVLEHLLTYIETDPSNGIGLDPRYAGQGA